MRNLTPATNPSSLLRARIGNIRAPITLNLHEHKPKKTEPDTSSNVVKDSAEWTTGDETMTGAQASHLKTLCEEAGEPFDASLTKAEASRMIDSLQAKTGRGRNH